ncbi:MAG: hypothetical protein EBS01_10880 [Verrucomicrobia bacterium]|nr:hypothetical protein [Verrucomicrobiota bacterium]
MQSVRTLFLLALLALGPSTQAGIPLSEADVDKALEAIWLKSPKAEQRSPESAKRAALDAYLQQFGAGGGILEEAAQALSERDFPALQFHAEILSGAIGYVRLGAFSPELSGKLETALRDFKQLQAKTLLLDLRATPAQGSLDSIVELAACFLPANTLVCEWRTATQAAQPVYTQKPPVAQFNLVLLTGPRTAGPVEALAAALRSQGRALIFGSKTQGLAADFDSIALSRGRFLRLPVREALFAREPRLYPDGLLPDILIKTSPEASDAALLQAAKDGKLSRLLAEPEHPRTSEASLVAGKNPETEAWITAQLKKDAPSAPPVRDKALLRVLDYLQASDALGGEPRNPSQFSK